MVLCNTSISSWPVKRGSVIFPIPVTKVSFHLLQERYQQALGKFQQIDENNFRIEIIADLRKYVNFFFPGSEPYLYGTSQLDARVNLTTVDLKYC